MVNFSKFNQKITMKKYLILEKNFNLNQFIIKTTYFLRNIILLLILVLVASFHQNLILIVICIYFLISYNTKLYRDQIDPILKFIFI